MTCYVTHRATLRAVQMVLGVDMPPEAEGLPDAHALDLVAWLGLANIQGIRASLLTVAEAMVAAKTPTVTINGVRYVMEGAALVTVVNEDAAPPHGPRKRKPRQTKRPMMVTRRVKRGTIRVPIW